MDTNIEAVLTEDQKPGYEKYKGERKAKMQERGLGGGMRPGGKR
ncbi:MAG: hypothetical protein HW412_2324 [Bacteroidetes bacterium]|nr:hypothetical protein [Bacteroidota bacterium]